MTQSTEAAITIRIVPLHTMINLGCTECGQRAIQAVVYVDGHTLGVVAVNCEKHAMEDNSVHD